MTRRAEPRERPVGARHTVPAANAARLAKCFSRGVMVITVPCPHCVALLEVPDSLAGCLVRCHTCNGVLRAPVAEGGEATAEGQTAQPRNPEAQRIVEELEQQAQKELEKLPYHRRRIPIDLIAGLVLSGGGLALLLKSLLVGMDGGLLVTLVYGILFPTMLILLGAACLRSWSL